MAWDKDKPAGNQKMRLSDEEIRANWEALEDFLAKEHYFPEGDEEVVHKFPVVTSQSEGQEGAIEILNDLLTWFSNGAWRNNACPYPVGAIYESLTDATPSTTWPGTTWQAVGTGQVLVGIDVGDPDFYAIGLQGGAKTHTLTSQELASHYHSALGVADVISGYISSGTYGVVNDDGATGFAGGNQPHNNLQPFFVVYRYVRLT